MPSQHCSLSGTRTTLTFQPLIAAIEAASCGPSKMPQPWMQAYSVPERLTPSRRTGRPVPSTNWLPAARNPVIPYAATGTPAAGVAVATAAGVAGVGDRGSGGAVGVGSGRAAGAV